MTTYNNKNMNKILQYYLQRPGSNWNASFALQIKVCKRYTLNKSWRNTTCKRKYQSTLMINTTNLFSKVISSEEKQEVFVVDKDQRSIAVFDRGWHILNLRRSLPIQYPFIFCSRAYRRILYLIFKTTFSQKEKHTISRRVVSLCIFLCNAFSVL